MSCIELDAYRTQCLFTHELTPDSSPTPIDKTQHRQYARRVSDTFAADHAASMSTASLPRVKSNCQRLSEAEDLDPRIRKGHPGHIPTLSELVQARVATRTSFAAISLLALPRNIDWYKLIHRRLLQRSGHTEPAGESGAAQYPVLFGRGYTDRRYGLLPPRRRVHGPMEDHLWQWDDGRTRSQCPQRHPRRLQSDQAPSRWTPADTQRQTHALPRRLLPRGSLGRDRPSRRARQALNCRDRQAVSLRGALDSPVDRQGSSSPLRPTPLRSQTQPAAGQRALSGEWDRHLEGPLLRLREMLSGAPHLAGTQSGAPKWKEIQAQDARSDGGRSASFQRITNTELESVKGTLLLVKAQDVETQELSAEFCFCASTASP